MRRFLAVVAWSASLAGVALAQGNPEAPREQQRREAPRNDSKQREALRLFEEARHLADQARFDEACAMFAQSYELERAPGTMLNLGDCAEREGKLRRAWQMYEAAAREYDKMQRVAAAKFARDRAAALAPRLATVIVRIAEPAMTGLTVRIGEHAVPAAAEITDRVELGPITVAVDAPGRASFRASANAIGGTQIVIVVPPLQVVAGAPRQRRVGARQRNRVWLAAGLAGAGIVGLGVSGIIGLTAKRAYDEPFDEGRCTNPDKPMCTPEGVKEIDDAGKLADRATYIAIGSAVLVAAGAVVFLTAPRERVAIAPVASPSSVGLALSGRF